jgi:uncharacterized protein (TIGR02186 family)
MSKAAPTAFRSTALFLALLVTCAATPASAQEAGEPRENITIGLSSETVQVATDFSGTELTIFGSVNNARADAVATGGYDVVVVLEGPRRPVVVREKERVLGMWINADSFQFEDVPRSYVLAATRNLRDIATDEAFTQLSLGVDQRSFAPTDQDAASFRIDRFSAALRERKISAGLYAEGVGNVRFLSQSLFKAALFLPADVPLGTHRARAFLFRNGVFLDEDSTGLYVAKDSFEQWLFLQSRENGALYGLASLLAAILIGWGGRFLFRKD